MAWIAAEIWHDLQHSHLTPIGTWGAIGLVIATPFLLASLFILVALALLPGELLVLLGDFIEATTIHSSVNAIRGRRETDRILRRLAKTRKPPQR